MEERRQVCAGSRTEAVVAQLVRGVGDGDRRQQLQTCNIIIVQSGEGEKGEKVSLNDLMAYDIVLTTPVTLYQQIMDSDRASLILSTPPLL